MRVFVVCALLFTGSDDHLGIGLLFFFLLLLLLLMIKYMH